MNRPTRIARVLFWTLGALLGPLLESASADIGVPLLRASEGGFEVEILATPAPLRVGASEWTAWVRDRASGRVMRDVSLELDLMRIEEDATTPPHRHHHEAGITAPMSPNAASDQRFRSARLELPRPGRWTGGLRVSRGDDSVTVPFEFEVQPARSVFLRHWIAFAIVPVGLLLFGLQQWRVHGRPRQA